MERGAFKRLVEEKLEAWEGPFNYISHHDVPKPSSKSTRIRIVSNSSLNNNNKGYSYNDCLPKGPGSLVPLLECMVTWDYSKCYNSVWTTPAELHCRRFVWRWKVGDPWEVFGIDRMHFGDRPAAIGLEVAKGLVAQAGAHMDPATAKMIAGDYVDDGFGRGTAEDVARLMGEWVAKDGTISYHGLVPAIMALGGFQVKYMVKDREVRQEVLDQFGGQVLGIPWDMSQDVIRMRMKVNLSPRSQKIHMGENISADRVEEIRGTWLTKRVMMSQIYSIYDPLGLLSPITIKYKLLLQRMVVEGLEWDEPLDGELLNQSQAVLKEMVLAGEVEFPRSVVPEEADPEEVELAGFTDGGDPASAACLYVLTERKEPGAQGQTHTVRLLAAKARVTPSSTKASRLRASTPGTEMRGILCLARLVTAVLEGFPVQPKSIFLAVDSECTISAVEAKDRVLQVWFSNRVAEVNDHMDAWRRKGIEVEELHHWPGLSNVADLATKGKASLGDIGPGTSWQEGPQELQFKRARWPASREFKRTLPPEEVKLGTCMVVDKQFSLLGLLLHKQCSLLDKIPAILKYSNNLDVCLKVLARVRRGADHGREQIKKPVSVDDLVIARRLVDIVSAWEVTKNLPKLSSLDPFKKDGVWVTQGRMREGLQVISGRLALQVLMPDQRLAELVMWKAHCQNHDASAVTLARSRAMVWVHRGRDLARRVCKACIVCWILTARMNKQKMGLLPRRGSWWAAHHSATSAWTCWGR